MEYFDVVDDNNQLLGKIEERNIVHEKGLWHREVSLWILNDKGEVLVQKRAATKIQAPNKWGTTAGHITAGDEPIDTVIREANEEIGLSLKKEDLNFCFINKIYKKFNDKQYNNCFQYCYYVKVNKEINEYIIQEEELSEVKYISLDELERIVNEKDEEYTFCHSTYMPELIKVLREANK